MHCVDESADLQKSLESISKTIVGGMLSLQNSYDQAATTLSAFSSVVNSDQRAPLDDLSRLVKLLRGHLCKKIETVSDSSLKNELLKDLKDFYRKDELT